MARLRTALDEAAAFVARMPTENLAYALSDDQCVAAESGAVQLAHFVAVEAASAVALLPCSSPAEPGTDPIPSREQLFIPGWWRRAIGRVAALDIRPTTIGERPEVAFVTPPWRRRT